MNNGPIAFRDQLDGVSVKVVSHCAGLGAGQVIALCVDVGSHGPSQSVDARAGYHTSTKAIEEADYERLDILADARRQNARGAAE